MIDKSKIRRAVLTELARQGVSRFVPVGISARHIHLSEADMEILFGQGHRLKPIKDLSQPGQYAAEERLTVIGPKGRIENVRVLGPARKASQVEISVSDAYVLGLKGCPVRLSGDLEGTPGIRLSGPKGQVELKNGSIVAARHLHLSEEQATAFGIHDRQVVAARVEGVRPCILENIICRTGREYEMELHLDTDEANACGLKNDDLVELLISGAGIGCIGVPESSVPKSRECECRSLVSEAQKAEAQAVEVPKKNRRQEAEVPEEELLDLVTEQDINDAYRDNKSQVYCLQKALITPAAKDRAAAAEIRIIRIKGKDENECR